jgi:hypothetical protein
MDNNSKIQQLKAIAHELSELCIKAQNHIEERLSSDGYVYASTYSGWINEHNQIIEKYNILTSANFSLKKVSDYELSSSQKTIRTDIAKSFTQSIKELSEKINNEIATEQSKETPIAPHQMRKCFKLKVRGCPANPVEKKNKVFIAMPFSDDYKDSYEYAIKLVLEQSGAEYYKADDEINNKDMMCKVCGELQSCGRIIVNISGHNPNVMLELGLAYGLGKEVIVIKDKKTSNISDLGSIEYIEYAHAGELQEKLRKIFL